MDICKVERTEPEKTEYAPEYYLQKYFGYKSFRHPQKEIIENILAGNDTLVLMPTGGGKSICFQLPACIMQGVTLVISPLISLMKDQVEALKTNGIEAEFLNSSLSAEEDFMISEKLRKGKIKLLYISPERLFSSKLIDLLESCKVSLIAIDEAHCISGWGHDFRPEYAQLSVLKERYPSIPIAALTATADRAVREDITEILGMQNASLFVSSFDRPNLSLSVLPAKQRFKKITELIDRYPDQSGIIYCATRKQTENLTEKLEQAGYTTGCYHGGLDAQVRNKVQEDFINGQVKIICATLAFGMGIDKSDVRFVIHYNLPKNLEGYYQEIGRAGRDGLPAETILFYGYGDVAAQMYYIDQISDIHYRKIQEDKLHRIQEYAESQICRRKVLLSYFSEFTESDCGNCDVCLNPPSYADGTTEAKMALSAISRVNQDEGISTVIDILRGNLSAHLKESGYQTLKTFGCGRHISNANWTMYIQQFIQQGFIEIDYKNRNKLKLTPLSREVLYGSASVRMVSFETIRQRNEALKSKSKEKVKIADPDELLFEKLRKLRKTLSDQMGKPPYTVFSDATLKQMAELKPTDVLSLLDVSGVGEHKASHYGELFLNEIATHLHHAPFKNKSAKAGDSQTQTIGYFNQNMSIEEIAQIRNLTEGTVFGHIFDYYKENGEEFDVFRFLTSKDYKSIKEVWIKFEKSSPLKPYFEYFEGYFDYNILRLALLHMSNAEKNTSLT